MNFGGPEFVLAIIGMAMFAGVMKTAIRAKNGLSDPSPHGRRGRREQSADVARLENENASLREQKPSMT